MPQVERGFSTAVEAYSVVTQKWGERYRHVRDAFLTLDTENVGSIGAPALRSLVEALGLRMSSVEFRRLWRMFDPSGEGRLSYAQFNKVLGPLIHPSSWGITNTMRRPETPVISPALNASLAGRLRRKIQDIEAVWRELDPTSSGFISHEALIAALRRMGMKGMGDAESWALMQRYCAPGNASGSMTRAEFTAAMQDLLHATPLPAPAEEPEYVAATLAAAERELSRVLPRSDRAAVEAALAPADASGTGELSYAAFRAALEACGAELDAPQFALLARRYDTLAEGSIDLRDFASLYCSGGAEGGAGGEGGGSPRAPAEGAGGGLATPSREGGGDGGFEGGAGSARSTARGSGVKPPSPVLGDYGPWAQQGIKPMPDPMTGRPLDMRKLARWATPKVRWCGGQGGGGLLGCCGGRLLLLHRSGAALIL